MRAAPSGIPDQPTALQTVTARFPLNEAVAFAAALRVSASELLSAAGVDPGDHDLASELNTLTAQRLELTQRINELANRETTLKVEHAELVRRLELIDSREAEARKKWQAARAAQDSLTVESTEHPPVSPAIAKELYANAVICAYPNCGRALYRVNDDGSRTLNSRIAHICARQKGGPRWDPQMTSEENRSVGNLLLLCIEHADEIDLRAALYTPDVLREWKRDQLTRVDSQADGWAITDPDASEAIRISNEREVLIKAGVLNLGGWGGNAPSAGGGGGAAVGKGATSGPGGAGGPITINVHGHPGIAPGAGGGGAGYIDPDSPLFWRGEGTPTFGSSVYLGTDGNDGGDTTFGPDDNGHVLRAKGGPGGRVGTGIRSTSSRLAVSSLVLANHVEFRENFAYITGTGFSFYNVLSLGDSLHFTGLAVLECGGTEVGEYGLVIEALDPIGNAEATVKLAFGVTETGDMLRQMFRFTLGAKINRLGMWSIVVRHEDRELARLPVVVKQGVPPC